MKLLMVIPAYNEEDNIVGVVNTIKEKYPEYDYIVVNDGSTDHTSRRCHKHGFEIISKNYFFEPIPNDKARKDRFL